METDLTGITLHSARSGPWWKRLRIALVGLTAEEYMENRKSFEELRRRAQVAHQVENAEDEMLLIRLEIAEFVHTHGRRPTAIKMSADVAALLRQLPMPSSPMNISPHGETFDGIPVRVTILQQRYFELE